ncbi:MAG TPA: ScpA family protein, partial [Bacillota bacterium]|nr:ScpA family protein [Bacillota bacterium]
MITVPTQAAKEGPAAFNTAGYSGPLSLLLELIEQRKVDICEVSLADITDDYLRRISALEWPDLEESSRFLVIAATLIFIKARVLMPKRKDLEAAQEEEEGPDPAELLVDRLRAYKLFRDAARKFKVLEAEASR